jgi:hypothetical protein
MIYVPDHQVYLRRAQNPHSFVQFKPRRIIDADGDGVEDNVKLDQYELDKYRKMVFSAPVEDLHNTHNGEMPGHHRFGDSPEPGVNPWANAMAREKAEYAARVEQKRILQEAEAKGFTGVQLDSQISFDEVASNSDYDTAPIIELSETTQKGAYEPRKINDADGDGVEDNVKKTQAELDRFRKPVFGDASHDMHNTKHGDLPGHTRAGEDTEPATAHPNGATKVATEENNEKAVESMSKDSAQKQLVQSQSVDSYSERDTAPSLLQLQSLIQSPEDLDQ